MYFILKNIGRCAHYADAQACGLHAHGCAHECITCHADVLRALHNAVEYYTEIGRLSMAAKNLRVRRRNLKAVIT